MMVCDSGTRSNKVTSDSFYWGTCHWKMPVLAPEMQQVLAGILAAILWTYFQGGRMCFKKMKSDEIELCYPPNNIFAIISETFRHSGENGLQYKTEPRHDKTNKVTVRPAKTQISLGIRPV